MPSRSLPKQCKPQGQMAVMTASDWWGLLAVPAEQDGGVAVQSRCALRSLVPSRIRPVLKHRPRSAACA